MFGKRVSQEHFLGQRVLRVVELSKFEARGLVDSA